MEYKYNVCISDRYQCNDPIGQNNLVFHFYSIDGAIDFCKAILKTHTEYAVEIIKIEEKEE